MANQALKIVRGSTFRSVFRYESPKKVYKLITNISNTAPVVITAVGHGIPANWRVKVTDVVGMTNINSTEEYREATKLTADTIEINDINAVGFKPYTSGGVLEYNAPVDLTGYQAKLQVRPSVDSETVLMELDTGLGFIIIEPEKGTITINIPATMTEAITWDKGVYSLELVSASGYVEVLLEGKISSTKEVTRGPIASYS